jgi:hypothetical protein
MAEVIVKLQHEILNEVFFPNGKKYTLDVNIKWQKRRLCN